MYICIFKHKYEEGAKQHQQVAAIDPHLHSKSIFVFSSCFIVNMEIHNFAFYYTYISYTYVYVFKYLCVCL